MKRPQSSEARNHAHTLRFTTPHAAMILSKLSYCSTAGTCTAAAAGVGYPAPRGPRGEGCATGPHAGDVAPKSNLRPYGKRPDLFLYITVTYIHRLRAARRQSAPLGAGPFQRREDGHVGRSQIQSARAGPRASPGFIRMFGSAGWVWRLWAANIRWGALQAGERPSTLGAFRLAPARLYTKAYVRGSLEGG